MAAEHHTRSQLQLDCMQGGDPVPTAGEQAWNRSKRATPWNRVSCCMRNSFATSASQLITIARI